jgi:hypothetical protein
MKKTIILILIVGFLSIGVNVYAQGDLSVEGKVGVGTTSPEFKLSLDGDGGIIAKGTYGSGATLTTSGEGVRLIWYPKKAAFRAGYVDGTQWDDVNIGDYSIAMGYRSKASGMADIAIGRGVASADYYSISIGSMIASGRRSIAIGNEGFQEYITSGINAITVGYGNNAGDFAVLVGAGNITSTGDEGVIVGSDNYISSTRGVVVGNLLKSTADKAIVIGNGVRIGSSWYHLENNIANSIMLGSNSDIPTMTITESSGPGTTGDVGIGTTDPQGYKLYVNGSIYASGGYYPSDAKFKKDIASIESPLEKILQMRGISFKWNIEEYRDRDFPEGRHYGLIGQEVEEILPEVVRETSKGEKSISYTELIPLLIEAVKEQQGIIEELKAKIQELEARDLITQRFIQE